MNINEIIEKKRDKKTLTKEEIKFFIDGYTKGEIPDYQISALLMAIYLNDMNTEETVNLTEAMMLSGEVINLDNVDGIKVDKHSTGGVGDKTTLIVGPIVSACGIPVAKMSGRGLGFTGGTVDKLNSIKNFKTEIDKESFINQVNDLGISIISQTGKIAPADKKIYALRDVTGTVGNISLIAGSIMSKKLAGGSDAIVLDVKCGKGAFMEDIESAKKLSKIMIDIGKAHGKNTIAVITDMNQPLGCAVGNSLEVIEAIEVLKGNGPKDLIELSLSLSALMLYAGGKADTLKKGKDMAQAVIDNKEALNKFKGLLKRQGADVSVVDDYSSFENAFFNKNIRAEKSGYISEINAKIIGLSSQKLGAGRMSKEDDIDMASGVYLHKKVGDYVKEGEVIATIYADSKKKLDLGYEFILKAWEIVEDKIDAKKLIKMILIDGKEVESVSEF